MGFIDNIFQSPTLTGMFASVVAMVYFILMQINPNLPAGLIFALAIGYVVYLLKSNTVGKVKLPAITDNISES